MAPSPSKMQKIDAASPTNNNQPARRPPITYGRHERRGRTRFVAQTGMVPHLSTGQGQQPGQGNQLAGMGTVDPMSAGARFMEYANWGHNFDQAAAAGGRFLYLMMNQSESETNCYVNNGANNALYHHVKSSKTTVALAYDNFLPTSAYDPSGRRTMENDWYSMPQLQRPRTQGPPCRYVPSIIPEVPRSVRPETLPLPHIKEECMGSELEPTTSRPYWLGTQDNSDSSDDSDAEYERKQIEGGNGYETGSEEGNVQQEEDLQQEQEDVQQEENLQQEQEDVQQEENLQQVQDNEQQGEKGMTPIKQELQEIVDYIVISSDEDTD